MDQRLVTSFVKALRDTDSSKHQAEVFRDFAELAYCALAKTRAPSPDRAEALEAQYLDVVRRYRDPDDVHRMPELLGLSLQALNRGGGDFLGTVAGEIGCLSDDPGQFFTPYEVSRLMAETNLADVGETGRVLSRSANWRPRQGACCWPSRMRSRPRGLISKRKFGLKQWSCPAPPITWPISN